MAYANTGYARCKTLAITKGDASKPYRITDKFTYQTAEYPALTDDEFAKLSESEYNRRRSAFISYMYATHEGLQSDCPDMTLGSLIYDVTLCPIQTATSL